MIPVTSSLSRKLRQTYSDSENNREIIVVVRLMSLFFFSLSLSPSIFIHPSLSSNLSTDVA